MTYTPDQWQEAIVALANAGAGAIPDIVATGTLTAAQPTVGTPVAGGTVSVTLGDGQATVEAVLNGTWNAGTTAIFEGTEDSGVTTNWFPMFGQDTGVSNPPNISSIAGGASKLVRIPSMGYAQVRIRANPFAGGDSVTVRLVASVAGSGMAGALSTNDGTFAKETGGVLGATTDAAVVGDVNGTHSAKLRGLSKILNAVWDSVNNLLNTNTSRIGGTAVSANTGTVDAGTQRMTLATDVKVPAKAASGDFADGANATLGAKADAAITDATTTNSQMSFTKGFVKILADVWDSTNHLLHFNLKQVGGNAVAVGSNAVPILNSAASGYVAAYGSNAAALTANTDYLFKWGAGGTTQVNHVMIYNGTALNVLWDEDTATNAGSPILAPGQYLFLDVQTTALHIQANGTPNVNGSTAANIVVRGWL